MKIVIHKNSPVKIVFYSENLLKELMRLKSFLGTEIFLRETTRHLIYDLRKGCLYTTINVLKNELILRDSFKS